MVVKQWSLLVKRAWPLHVNQNCNYCIGDIITWLEYFLSFLYFFWPRLGKLYCCCSNCWFTEFWFLYFFWPRLGKLYCCCSNCWFTEFCACSYLLSFEVWNPNLEFRCEFLSSLSGKYWLFAPPQEDGYSHNMDASDHHIMVTGMVASLNSWLFNAILQEVCSHPEVTGSQPHRFEGYN